MKNHNIYSLYIVDRRSFLVVLISCQLFAAVFFVGAAAQVSLNSISVRSISNNSNIKQINFITPDLGGLR